jgi:hypothetical protein
VSSKKAFGQRTILGLAGWLACFPRVRAAPTHDDLLHAFMGQVIAPVGEGIPPNDQFKSISTNMLHSMFWMKISKILSHKVGKN